MECATTRCSDGHHMNDFKGRLDKFMEVKNIMTNTRYYGYVLPLIYKQQFCIWLLCHPVNKSVTDLTNTFTNELMP